MGIDTARLHLRPYRQTDLDALHRLWTDADVRRHLWDDVAIDRSTAAQAMQASIASTAERGWGHWAVCPGGADDLIGFCGFRELDDGPEIELLYGLAPAHWHRGLATEAARAMLDRGFARHGFARVFAVTDTANAASRAVIARLAMELECHLGEAHRPMERYVISRARWSRQ